MRAQHGRARGRRGVRPPARRARSAGRRASVLRRPPALRPSARDMAGLGCGREAAFSVGIPKDEPCYSQILLRFLSSSFPSLGHLTHVCPAPGAGGTGGAPRRRATWSTVSRAPRRSNTVSLHAAAAAAARRPARSTAGQSPHIRRWRGGWIVGRSVALLPVCRLLNGCQHRLQGRTA